MSGRLSRPPAVAEHVFEWFKELDATRGNTGWGPLPLDFVQIEAWSRLRDIRIRPWELALIRRMDVARLRLHYAQQSGQQLFHGRPAEVSERPLTPELFDALF